MLSGTATTNLTQARNCVSNSQCQEPVSEFRVYKNVFRSAGKLVGKGSPAVTGQVTLFGLFAVASGLTMCVLAAFAHIAEDHTHLHKTPEACLAFPETFLWPRFTSGKAAVFAEPPLLIAGQYSVGQLFDTTRYVDFLLNQTSISDFIQCHWIGAGYWMLSTFIQ